MAHIDAAGPSDEARYKAVLKRLEELREGVFSERSVSAGDMRAITAELLHLVKDAEPLAEEDGEDIED